ncbi:unnamed protein product [Rotaria sp. Silwood1]|nr:unnamed protein product [Rotaria sp. Silwood1]CAF1595636.1 unnamed protein product [Rotaria sp. Silwood1]CAF3711811.1 unnamed protein product [Rotaria sp. Silwood1]
METDESRHTKFSILISIQIPSIICYIGLIYHMISNRPALQAVYNHAPLVMLFVGAATVLVDLSMVLNFLRTGIVIPTSDIYCHIWNFIDFLLYALASIMMLWQSIEKHILIFHYRQLLNTRKKRFFFHYAPLITIFLYLALFYVIFPWESSILLGERINLLVSFYSSSNNYLNTNNNELIIELRREIEIYRIIIDELQTKILTCEKSQRLANGVELEYEDLLKFLYE